MAAGVIAFALLAAACGGAAEVVNEQLLESIEGVENVEINEDDGSFEVTIEENGESITIGGGEIPEGLTVPVPSGGDVVGAASSDNDISVSLMYPGDQYDNLVAQYQAWADGSGQEVAKSESTYESKPCRHRPDCRGKSYVRRGPRSSGMQTQNLLPGLSGARRAAVLS